MRTSSGILILIAPVAAAVNAQTIARPIVRDSAGIRIVEHATIKTDVEAFRPAAQPIATAGGLRDDPKEEFDTRTGYEVAVRLSNGDIAVAEFYSVRVVDSRGKFVRTLGSNGGGPGQFNSQLAFVCRMRGDTLILAGGRQVSVFDPAGAHVRSFVSDNYVSGRGCFDDGTLLSRARGPNLYQSRDPAALAGVQTQVTLMRMTREGRAGDSIGTFPGEIGLMPYKVIEDRFDAEIHGDRIHVGNGATNEFRVVDVAGKLVMIVRWKDEIPPVTSAKLREQANARLPLSITGGDRSAQIEEAMSRRHRETMPVYSGLIVDAAGRTWIRDPFYKWKEQEGRPAWTVFASDGSLLGRYRPPAISTPARVMVTDIGTDHIVLRASSRETGITVVVNPLLPAR